MAAGHLRVTLIASACPTIDKMTATVPPGQRGCNRTGCHTASGAGRVHLPWRAQIADGLHERVTIPRCTIGADQATLPK